MWRLAQFYPLIIQKLKLGRFRFTGIVSQTLIIGLFYFYLIIGTMLKKDVGFGVSVHPFLGQVDKNTVKLSNHFAEKKY